ncbi:hypothetical protein [Rhodomicrobium lacus]|uniref:hypothetical protein n=1 Tax=Rhodomicrobium lacus TaxID=2498452 RepID=UPI000F8DA6F7|nr:hypothetical protein [Rhodomicrobium lacus]
MAHATEFYSRAKGVLGENEDSYRLVFPDDGAPAFVEHEWFYHDPYNAGPTESDSARIAIQDFFSADHPREAKERLRGLLRALEKRM